MNLTQIRQALAAHQIRLTKSLGQNFLHDTHQIARIIQAAELSSTDRVLEIGPGLGALTQRLLEISSHVLSIEKDRRLAQFLATRFAQDPHLELIQADALEYLRTSSADWSNWKVVSNLPYSVASPILVEAAQASRPPQRLVVTLQREVVDRLCASAGQAAYGLLTLLIQLRYQPGPAFPIPASCFFPVPEVDSACITLLRRPNLLLDVELVPVFERIVKRSFSQRRKMMLKLLKSDWPVDALESAFAELGISPQIRAEAVTLDQYVRLTTLLAQGSIKP
jgi:16S rRNA (adenine1518-N6/adenine1519-N6)-dimethyltransferase